MDLGNLHICTLVNAALHRMIANNHSLLIIVSDNPATTCSNAAITIQSIKLQLFFSTVLVRDYHMEIN